MFVCVLYLVGVCGVGVVWKIIGGICCMLSCLLGVDKFLKVLCCGGCLCGLVCGSVLWLGE